jgi:hypothetical protein
VIEATSGARFEVALERFLGGLTFEFRGVSFAMAPEGTVVVRAGSSWSPSNVTVESVNADIELCQSATSELVACAEAFASAVRGRPIRYEVVEDWGTGSVLLCAMHGGRLTWSPGLPGPAAPMASRSVDSALPAEVTAATVRWLSGMDDGLAALAKTARALGPPAGPSLALAVSEVTDRVAHFRLAMAGAFALAELMNSDTHPLTTMERSVALKVHRDVLRVAALPADVRAGAQTHLTDYSLRGDFLRQVGDVAGHAFINLARQLWEDHPDLAPPGWTEQP